MSLRLFWSSTRILFVFNSIATFLIVVASAAPRSAAAGSLYIYEHNGSVMHWFEAGDEITITYDRPRAGLQKVGIKPGSVLFKGHYEGSGVFGEAFAFKAGCEPAPYSVMGYEAGGSEIVTLRGPGPKRVTKGCRVTGYSVDSPHAELVFNYSATHH